MYECIRDTYINGVEESYEIYYGDLKKVWRNWNFFSFLSYVIWIILYCNKFKITQNPKVLFAAEEVQDLAVKMFHEEKHNIENGVYDGRNGWLS